LQTTADLINQRREQLHAKNITIVSESGLHTPENLKIVQQAGANAVLIGESLLIHSDPGSAIASLYNG
jgi:indole-3-glycerol phosphate synthase